MRSISEVATRSERLEARVSNQQKQLFIRAAELQGLSLTDFVLSAISDAANQVVSEHEIIRLTRRDQIAFAEALLAPPQALPRLQSAVDDYFTRVKP